VLSYRIQFDQLLNRELSLSVPINHLGDILEESAILLYPAVYQEDYDYYLGWGCIAFNATADNLSGLWTLETAWIIGILYTPA